MKKLVYGIFLLFILCFAPATAQDKITLTNEDSGVYIFKINTKKYGEKIKPLVTPKLMTPEKVYDDNCYDLVLNGGFFDVVNGKSVSYVIINGKMEADIKDYPELIENLEKEKRLDNVLNRAELRILENKRHKLKFDIAYHNDSIQKGYSIKHSLQAGPMLLPYMDLVKEGFVVMDGDMVKFQSADILKRRPRTIVGLKGKYLYLVVFTKDHKVDANEARNYLKENLKLKKIMALDGGLSTSVNYQDLNIGSLGKYQRRVKSFLVIER